MFSATQESAEVIHQTWKESQDNEPMYNVAKPEELSLETHVLFPLLVSHLHLEYVIFKMFNYKEL